MERISRRNFIKAAGVSLASVSLAACGSESKATSTSSSSSIVPVQDETGKDFYGNTYVSDLPIAIEPIEYTIMNLKVAMDKSNSQSDKEIVKLSTADTNITLNWTETSNTAYGDSALLMLATGDGLPDAFLTTTISEDQIASNPEDFYAIDEETFKTFAPNIYKAFEENVEGGIDVLKKADGKIYSLPSGVWSEYANWADTVTYIRQDWLDDLGMKMPTTVDELYDVLVAFKENCKSDKGGAITPMIFSQSNWAGKIQFMSGPWGVAGRKLNNDQWFIKVENGKCSLNINTQGFKDFLLEMHKWHKAGLLNIDGFSMSNPEFQSLVNENAHGMIGTWTPVVSEWEEGKWAALPVLTAKGYEGKELKTGETNMRTAQLNSLVITTTCKEPEGLLRWWDHCHSSAEWKRIGRDGPEGGAWEYGADGVAYVKAVDPLPGECASDTDYHNTYGWRTLSPILFTGESAIPNPEKPSEDAIRYEVGKMYEGCYATEHVPVTPVPADAAAEFAFVKEEVDTAVENFMASAVMSGFTDEEWDTYVKNLDAIGAQDWVTYYQNWVDNNWA